MTNNDVKPDFGVGSLYVGTIGVPISIGRTYLNRALKIAIAEFNRKDRGQEEAEISSRWEALVAELDAALASHPTTGQETGATPRDGRVCLPTGEHIQAWLYDAEGCGFIEPAPTERFKNWTAPQEAILKLMAFCYNQGKRS